MVIMAKNIGFCNGVKNSIDKTIELLNENKKIYVPKLIEGTLDDGLTKFKDNFNPTINEFIGEFDIPIYPFMYRLTQKAYKILKSKHM